MGSRDFWIEQCKHCAFRAEAPIEHREFADKQLNAHLSECPGLQALAKMIAAELNKPKIVTTCVDCDCGKAEGCS